MKSIKSIKSINGIKGFTLIEMLVVIGVLITVSGVIVSIIVTVVRGAKKSDSIVAVKDNGEYAMDQIIKTLRFAMSLDSPKPLGGTAPVCSTAGTVVRNVSITRVDLSQNTFRCPASFTYPNYIALDGRSLTNSSTVVVTACQFVCRQRAGELPAIEVSFTLSKVNANGVQEANTTIPFQSSVTLRNLGGG